MKTWKKLLIFLVTFGLLAVVACLPGLAAAMSDRKFLNNPGSREMESVVLQLSGERRQLSTADKLELLRRGRCIPITEEGASMTPEEVSAALGTKLDIYISAGLLSWFEDAEQNMQPFLYIDPDDTDCYGIFWSITLLDRVDGIHSLNLEIDDETGRIYFLHYESSTPYSPESVWQHNYLIMDAFMQIYLNQLELLPSQGAVMPNASYDELDGDVLCSSIALPDEKYGELRLEFYVTGTGSFWVHLPD